MASAAQQAVDEFEMHDSLKPGPQPVDNRGIAQGWIEVMEPELFSFEAIGQRIQGVLLDLKMESITDRSTNTSRMIPVARFELDNGKQVKIRPSFDLQQKLGRRHMGKLMLIVYDRDNQVTIGKGNAMKMFRVFVATRPDAGAEPFVATDDDLPESL